MQEMVYTVSQLTEKIAEKLEYAPDLKAIWVKGEIAECTRSSMGHWYFNLKDEDATLKVVLFASQAKNLQIVLTSGIEVIVKGSVSVYRTRGVYQMLATEVESAGMGAYRLALIQLMEKLEKEGLFQQKRALPSYPFLIGVVTSKTGAAIADIRRIIGRRWPLAKIKLFPCTVQGEEAPGSIIKALKKAYQTDLDVLILARGGGSSDDLWAFNDEKVARTLFDSNVPTITGVGHEIDRTIVDLVADYCAPTPSGAAEVAVPDIVEVYDLIESLEYSLDTYVNNELNLSNKRLALLVKTLEKHEPQKEFKKINEKINALEKLLTAKALYSLEQKKQAFSAVNKALEEVSPQKEILAKEALIKELFLRLENSKKNMMWELKEKVTSLEYGLNLLNPENLLKKGYAVVYKEKEIIRSVLNVKSGTNITIVLADGQIEAKVVGVNQTKASERGKENG